MYISIWFVITSLGSNQRFCKIMGSNLFKQWLFSIFLVFFHIILVSLPPTKLLSLCYNRQVLLLTFYHNSFTFEEMIYKKVTQFFFEHVASLIVMILKIQRAPVAHSFHFIIYSLRKGLHALC